MIIAGPQKRRSISWARHDLKVAQARSTTGSDRRVRRAELHLDRRLAAEAARKERS